MNMDNLSFDKHLLLQFKRGLREQQGELLHRIAKTEKEIQEFASPVPLDAIDLSCFTASKEFLFARASQDRGRLRLIQRALERVNDGSFGICTECEDPIGLKRLQAVPWPSHDSVRSKLRSQDWQEKRRCPFLPAPATLLVLRNHTPAGLCN